MIAIIDSGGQILLRLNLLLNDLEKSILTTDPKIIQSADHVLLPGVGSAHVAMKQLRKHGLIEVIKNLQQPLMGICLGMQLLFRFSNEGSTSLLNIVSNSCIKFEPSKTLSVPHMGWNQINFCSEHPLTFRLKNGDNFYFVHSFYAPVSKQTVARCNHGVDFTAIVAKNNFVGCQFHPERSGTVGAQILKNFVELTF